MASQKILEIMDEVIKEMKSKTPEELFDTLYNNSPYFKAEWDKIDIKNSSQTIKKLGIKDVN